jgi:tetratricopeptide (TPR) repeat protein
VVKRGFHLVKPIGKAFKFDLLYITNTNSMRQVTAILFLLLTSLFISNGLQAQGTTSKPAEIKKTTTNLEKSLLENNNFKIARNYELLAQEFTDKGDFAKASENLNKALELYTSTQNNTGRSRIIRNIAQLQESQNKLSAASKNYKIAANTATDETFRTLNLNDYNRLKNSGNFDIQHQYLDANIVLLKKAKKNSQVADTYLQQATLNLKKTDSTAALQYYAQALIYAKAVPAKAFIIYSKIATLQVAGKRYIEAIETVKELLAQAEKVKDKTTQIAQLQYIASIYFKINDTDSAVNALQKSYKIAAANGKTFEARESLLLLVEYYKSIGNDKASMEAYREFAQNLDRILLSDNSLTDAKTFKVTEERIRRLESEKTLKDELLTRRNTFNYFLLGAIVLLLLFFGSIVKALYSIKTKNKEIALQSLRREMNPHFLFNSLNSVNQFIAQNNELEANKYLTSYSNLMRNTMENSNKDFVTLGNEIENLTKYLELEHLRFKDKFNFEINIDETLDPDTIWVPNMVIQPNLENAIWHGLRYKEQKGLLKLNVQPAGKNIIITIDDNGIGPTKSNELKTHNQKAHNSRGLTNTKERIMLLNQLYKTRITFAINEKKPPETGTVVQIIFSIINKP